jgi:hypothetical protein
MTAPASAPELRGRTVVVVGLAQTGIAVAKFCARRGARVVVTDGKPADKLAGPIAQLAGVPVTWQLGGHDAHSFTTADLVVMSPGVPTLPEMTAARAAGVEVIAEIELAYRFLDPAAALIAITGTNGKSATTALTLCSAPAALRRQRRQHAADRRRHHPANAPAASPGRSVARKLHHVPRAPGAHTNITEDHPSVRHARATPEGAGSGTSSARKTPGSERGRPWVMREMIGSVAPVRARRGHRARR